MKRVRITATTENMPIGATVNTFYTNGSPCQTIRGLKEKPGKYSPLEHSFMSSADEIIVKVFIPKELKHKPKIRITSLGYFLGKTSFKDKTDRKGISPMAIGDSLDMSVFCIENYEDWKNEHNGASKIII